ncbi:MAG TPA: FAD binding domain-containing protein [Planctomycetota bacterium]|nr:FAD binding domain-containing protein [Planctomycetota bacterium]
MSARVTSPRTLDDALIALRDAAPATSLLAGGTDLMVELENGRAKPAGVVDLWRVGELRYLREEAGGLRIGALTTCRELLDSKLARERADLLVTAADQVGAEQIKNRATLGGNLGTASPASDLGPVLFALDARVRLQSLRGARELSIDEFWTGYRATARARDELIESIFVPERLSGERRGFRKVGTRAAQSISKVVAAVALRIEDGRFRHVRAGAGSIAERTLRLTTLERELEGAPADEPTVERATRASALRDARPIDDVRSTANYRRHAFQRVLHTLIGTWIQGAS